MIVIGFHLVQLADLVPNLFREKIIKFTFNVPDANQYTFMCMEFLSDKL